MQQPAQPTELTELDKIILKDRLDRHAKAEDEAFSFPPRTAGIALTAIVAFYATGNHIKPHTFSAGGFLPALLFLIVGFSTYSWSLLKRYDHTRRELSDTLLKLGVRPSNEVKDFRIFLGVITGASSAIAIIIAILLALVKP